MIDRTRIHEVESFQLVFAESAGEKLIAFMKSEHFEHEDDFFFRNHAGERWQAISVWSAECQLRGTETYPDEAPVDQLKLTYYFSSLPEDQFAIFLQDVTKIVTHLKADIRHEGVLIDLEQISLLFESWKKDLSSELAETPGSQSLAILVQDLLYQ